MDYKLIGKVTLGFLGVSGIAAASAYGTYKAYPKLKQAKDEDLPLEETVKLVAKDYGIAAGAVSIVLGLFIANEVIGDRKFHQLERRAEDLYYKLQSVQKKYVDHKAALESVGDEKLIATVEQKAKELESYSLSEEDKIIQILDVETGIIFNASKNEVRRAVNDNINKSLSKGETGYIIDMYNDLRLVLDPKFSNFGWNIQTACENHVCPYVEVYFEESRRKDLTNVFGELYEMQYFANYQFECSDEESPVLYPPIDDPDRVSMRWVKD